MEEKTLSSAAVSKAGCWTVEGHLTSGEANDAVRQRPGELKLVQHQDDGEAAARHQEAELFAKLPGKRGIDRGKGLIAQ